MGTTSPNAHSTDSIPGSIGPDEGLFRNPSFVGLLATQFLGAFNDNVYKQMVLLICLDYVRMWNLSTDPFQPIANTLFTVSFLAFSGFAGYLSDRYRKRKIIVLSKVAEIVVMASGLVALFIAPLGSSLLLWCLIIVLVLMGSQSAFFGPSKYGILPEMLHERHLPAANGWIQMTTFLAIIFGIALAGVLKVRFDDKLWIISVICIAIAIAGTLTSLLIRNRPPAQPNLRFSPSCLLIESSVWRTLVSDRPLLSVLFVYSVFWFAGGVVVPTVNVMGKGQLEWKDDLTSLVNACMALGIGLGCAVAGVLSRHRVAFWLVRVGAAGTAVAFAAVAVIAASALPAAAKPFWIGAGLFFAGGFAGLLAVPLQVFLQARPPAGQKGRVIGAMNLFTWTGILLSNGFYYICYSILSSFRLPPCWILAALSPIMCGIAVAFWPRVDRPPPQSAPA